MPKSLAELINLLPCELCLKVYKYLYDDAMYQIEGGGGPIIPIDMYYLFCPENSDFVRAEYLKRKYLDRKLNGVMPIIENDYWKLLVDLERPTVYCNPLCNWKHYYVRRWETMTQGYIRGGLYWNRSFDSETLTRLGWLRLTGPPGAIAPPHITKRLTRLNIYDKNKGSWSIEEL